MLTRVLEASGLREGYEYETQVSIENDARSRMQPDVIVRLPQGKDVVIDAKMTLVAYERALMRTMTTRASLRYRSTLPPCVTTFACSAEKRLPAAAGAALAGLCSDVHPGRTRISAGTRQTA